jgi:hypothetical protein
VGAAASDALAVAARTLDRLDALTVALVADLSRGPIG